ncbi:MAG: methyltransferase domain-containing protein [Defluviitaleaceae bacterium]|nr:methyltransferase domain-containing protein [Defluviitaleaceae bacterium]
MKNYSKSNKYDPAWIKENWMGPHPLWLLEELCEHLDLRPGMKVLDMGCGKGLTSVFLAKEYGVTVFANDLWIGATDNLRRFEAAGVADRVFPIHAEAHSLPYADEFFDAAVSVDSYHYYGTDETYFPCVYAKLVKPGGQFGMVFPGYTREFEKGHPDGILRFIAGKQEKEPAWGQDMFTFHSAAWWRRHFEKTGLVEITACYDIADVREIWESWAFGEKSSDDAEFLAADTENNVALITLAARKRGGPDEK